MARSAYCAFPSGLCQNDPVNSNQYLKGLNLFNNAEFFDAHEVLEDVWRAAPPENKKFCQGLVQVAVAFHHYSTGNRIGMRSVLERAIRNLGTPSGSFGQIQLVGLLQSLDAWRNALDSGSPVPPLPQMKESSPSQAGTNEI
jgi:predicted metal-dependent hydrolase